MNRKELRKNYKNNKKQLKKIYKTNKKTLKENYFNDVEEVVNSFEYQNELNIKKKEIRRLNEAPHLTLLEEIGNSVTHGVGALLAIIGLIILIIKSDTGLKLMGALFYGISLFIMMLSSCLYHAFSWGSTVKRIYRRFDYSSIYLLIGGTFSPILLVNVGNTYGIVWFIIMWTLIVTGITMVSIFGPGRLKWLHFPLYFILGWSGSMLIPYWISNYPYFFLWIIIGGVVYTIGMIPFLLRKKASHFIWHFFVLLGAFCHFIAIIIYIY